MATFSHWVWVVVWTQFVLFLTLSAPADGQKMYCPSKCSCLGPIFECRRRGLTEIPRDLPSWVEILDISQNEFTVLDTRSLQHITQLKRLKAAHNKLSAVPDLGSHPHLTELNLAHNAIPQLTSDLKKLPQLKNLDLSFNKITSISGGVFTNSSNLQYLSLSSNKISSIEKGSLDNLTSLQTLQLNRNRLATIPKNLFLNLKSLKQLELDKNRIRAIEGLSFKGLEALESLSLRKNLISHLSDGAFYYLGKIQTLNLDLNNITAVTNGWLYGLSSLRSLNLTHNAITEVDMGGCEYCKKLTHLELTFNNLQAITKSTFAKAESLRFLYLGHNSVSYIEEGAFKQLNQLKELYLDHNALSSTMEDTNGPFLGLSSLSLLTLSDNLIKSLTSRAFAGLGRLRSLDLSRNPITTISQGTFTPLRRRLTTLLLDSSSLLCDCNLLWLPAWIVRKGFQESVKVRCGHPPALEGLPVLNIAAENFTCKDFPKPQILLQSPENQVALKGQNITLVCKAATASASRLEFQWRKEQKFLSDVETEVSEQVEPNDVMVFTSYLHLRNIQNKDEGRYQCVIRNQFGSVYSNHSNISVYVLPSFVKTPSNLTVRAGGTARLECGATGQPTPTVSWQKDGGDDFPAARERRMHVMPTDDVFFVVALKAADSGVYTCTARSRAGVVRANATLTVLEAPAFVRPMRSKLVAAGDTAVLECLSSGSPKPRLTWLKDGAPLVATERHFLVAEAQLLVITDSRTTDSGQYACEMTNTLGIERGLSLLKVVPAKSSLGPLGPDAEGMTTGIVVIVVVVCIVGTSLVWVFIIYKTRKRQRPTCNTLPEAPPPVEPPRRPPEQEPFLRAEADVGDIHVTRDICADSGSDHSSKESGHQSCDDLGSQVDTSSQTFILGASRLPFFARGRREGSLSSASGSSSSQPSPPHVRATLTSFQPRAATGTLLEQTTLRHLTRHPIALGRPCPPSSSPSPVHSRTASASGQARSLSEGQLAAPRAASVPLARRHIRVRRGSSASSESSGASGASGGRGGSSDERDSGFSTFPRSVRSWSSASLHCRLHPREVVINGGSIATVSGAGSQQSCCLTPASVSQQDVASAASAEQQPAVTDVHLSPGRRRTRATLIIGSKRPPQPSPARRAPTTMASVV
nr:leucine-rich repeats and immunoglobulin-like domains protein 3 [Dermacentor andersoni]